VNLRGNVQLFSPSGFITETFKPGRGLKA
jgi:hypothetical protein